MRSAPAAGCPAPCPPTPWSRSSTRSCPGWCCRSSCCSRPWWSGAWERLGSHRRAGSSAHWLAVTLWQWNPFVAERLGLGHWPVLLGYAALPWLVVAARRWRVEQRMPAVLPLLVVCASLSASAGLATAAVLLVLATRRGGRAPGTAWRRWWPWRTRRGWSRACCTPVRPSATRPAPRCSRWPTRGRCPGRWRRSAWAVPGTPRCCPARVPGSRPGSRPRSSSPSLRRGGTPGGSGWALVRPAASSRCGSRAGVSPS